MRSPPRVAGLFRVIALVAWALAWASVSSPAWAEDDAPPPPPARRGTVLESTAGVQGFWGAFGRVAPPGLRLGLVLGREVLPWLMPFVYADVTATSTTRSQSPTSARAFPLLGGGGGVRVTVGPGGRGLWAAFLQGQVGLVGADAPAGALAILGFPDAESASVTYGARAGIELHPSDPHLAIGLQGGAAARPGFARTGTGGSAGGAWDGALALRYAF